MRRALALLAGLLAAAPAPAAPAAAVSHEMRVVLDPAARSLSGEDRIRVSRGGPAMLGVGPGFRLERVEVDGREQPLAAGASTASLQLAAGSEVRVRWQGSLQALRTDIGHRETLGRPVAASAAEGAFLPSGSGWYPQLGDATFSYRLSLELPAGLRGIVPGTLAEEAKGGGRWRARFEFAQPTDGIDLMAGPYRVSSRRIGTPSGKAVTLRTWFHPEVADLSDAYLDALKGYFDLYDRWIGAYPYDEFSVVSSPTPTGFGMPTLTYLGTGVLRLPFIRATSLGHEVLHNWWGNGVYVDYRRGNWSEGLTTFMADYAYKEREGPEAAREMRTGWLRDIAAVPEGQDEPLARFTSRTHGTSQIVGYNKAAMMFQMLRDGLGAEVFDAGIRRFWQDRQFRMAGWAELRSAFEQASGRDLQAFFAQWLERAGAPPLRLEAARAERAGAGWKLAVTLVQGSPAWTLRVPLKIVTDEGERSAVVDFAAARGEVMLESAARPTSVVLDPDFRLLRRLTADEAPPILREPALDPATRVVVAGDGSLREAGQTLAGRMLDHPPREVSAEAPPASPLLLIGSHDEVDRYLARHGLPPRPGPLAGRGTAQAWTARMAGGHVLLAVSARDADALAALVRPLPHYGRQSWVVFEGARAVDKGVWPGEPQRVSVAAD